MRLIALLAGLSLPVVAQSLAAKIDSILQSPATPAGVWGIQVIRLDSGEVLCEHNASLPMTPASNTKLFSTALALLRLGPDHRFRTQVFAAANPDAAGRLPGDLVLLGGGDPTLSAREYPYRKGGRDGDEFAPLRALAAEVAARGVRTIMGDLIADDSLYPYVPYGQGWGLDDATWEYGAPVSALTLHDNAFRLAFHAPKDPAEPVRLQLSPAFEYFTMHNRIRVLPDAAREIDVWRLPGSRVVTLTGTLPPGASASTSLALDEPAAYAGAVFRALLEDAGVTVLGATRVRHRAPGTPFAAPGGILLAERVSPPLSGILQVINKVSQNLHAEIAFRETARVTRGDALSELGRQALEAMLDEVGVPRDQHDLSDGSGLSRRGLVSPQVITQLLAYLHASVHRDAFYELLPIAGVDGSLENRFRSMGDVSAVRAKTGSLSHVNALSGYAGEKPGRRLAFSIVANHTTASAFAVRQVIDRIGKAILEESER
jgi:D-alanyl-D-alanine carboxypeptidase/D-alanyl-D-alanine-endopeptidase (penicillin-binding protein 4)